jgi:hypothetical protein
VLRKPPRKEWPHNFCCVNCVYEPNKDLGKYEAIYKNGRMRIKLRAISATLYVCPKCQDEGRESMHIGLDFKDPKADKRIRQRKQQKRHELLKAMHKH